MSDLRSLAVNVVAGILVFALGVVARQIYSWWRSLPVARFWRPIARGGVTLVLGRLDRSEFNRFEPSGVVGLGDIRALEELGDVFARGGLTRFSIAYGGALTEKQRRGNLILLGGVDGNRLSAELMRAVGSRIELTNEDEATPPVLLDTMNTPEYRLRPALDNGTVLRDFGVLIRARNPRDTQRWIVIIAGCLGLGTWAGVRLTLSPELAHSPAEFECVYRTHDDGGSPAEPVIVTGVRRLPPRFSGLAGQSASGTS